MKTKLKNRLLKALIAVTAIMAVIGGTIVLAEPGDTDDPVVTKNYIVNVVVPQLKAYVEERLGGGTSDYYADTFAVVNVSGGQTVVFDAGAQYILRKGNGVIIGNELGGICDTTAGYDLPDGTEMPSNHMLVVPRGDGRGFKASNDVIIMVKGGYSFR